MSGNEQRNNLNSRIENDVRNFDGNAGDIAAAERLRSDWQDFQKLEPNVTTGMVAQRFNDLVHIYQGSEPSGNQLPQIAVMNDGSMLLGNTTYSADGAVTSSRLDTSQDL